MYVVCVFLQFQGEKSGKANSLLAGSSKPTAKFLERVWKGNDALYTSDVQIGRVLLCVEGSMVEEMQVRLSLQSFDGVCRASMPNVRSALMPYQSRLLL